MANEDWSSPHGAWALWARSSIPDMTHVVCVGLWTWLLPVGLSTPGAGCHVPQARPGWPCPLTPWGPLGCHCRVLLPPMLVLGLLVPCPGPQPQLSLLPTRPLKCSYVPGLAFPLGWVVPWRLLSHHTNRSPVDSAPWPPRHAPSVSEPGRSSSGSGLETHAPQLTCATNVSHTVQGSGNSSQ